MTYEIEKEEAEWRQVLSPERYAILRQAAPEAPVSGSLLNVAADGVCSCGGGGPRLFTSDQKFDSDCGWPSFDACEPGTVIERPDHSLSRERTEILCSRCGGHLGHVFNDGPTQTGLRYCVNSLAIDFNEKSS